MCFPLILEKFMLKKTIGLIGIATLSLAATSVQAQNMYGDVAYQMIDTNLDTDPAVIRGIVGHQFSPNIAVEGMVGLNVRDGEESIYGVTAKGKVDRLLGVYVKSQYTIDDTFELYTRLGVVNYKISASAGYISVSGSGTDLSFGIGAGYKLTRDLSINVDYMDFGDLEGGASIGMKFAF
jgi:hypothetical protein